MASATVATAVVLPGDVPDPAPNANQRTLIAALEAFADLGYHGTSTRDIARRAGLSPAGLYVHFPSKESLLEHIVLTTHRAMLEVLQATVAIGGEPPETLFRLVHAHTAFHARFRHATRVANYELEALPSATRRQASDIRAQIGEILTGTLRRGESSGHFTVPDAVVTTKFIISSGVDVSRWYDPAGRLGIEELSDHYAALVVRSVTGAVQP